MLRVYNIYKYFTISVWGSTLDVRMLRQKSDPVLKGLNNIIKGPKCNLDTLKILPDINTGQSYSLHTCNSLVETEEKSIRKRY